MTTKFWKDSPTRPLRDWRTYMIGVPILSSATGAMVFMALSFSFTEMGSILPSVRTRMVILAAFATAFGSAFGSIGSGLEIYRKAFEKKSIWLDWTSLALSVLATLAGFVMGFAALLGATETWSEVARTWGPLALSALVALDAAGDLIELGGLFAAYNIRYATWEIENQEWMEQHGIIELPKPAPKADELVFDPSWPETNLDEIKRFASHLNGNRAEFNRAAMLRLAHSHERRLPKLSRSSEDRWAREVREAR